MDRGQIFTPAQLRVGRRPVLLPSDRERVEQALASSSSLTAAAGQLGVWRVALQRFVVALGLQVRRQGRPRVVLTVDQVQATLAAAPSLIAAARVLQVGRLLLRRFAQAHGLSWLDGRRRR